MPYRILIFDREKFELKRIQNLDKIICPKNTYLKNAGRLQSKNWIWCTDKIYLLNEKFKPIKILCELEAYPRIFIQAKGNFLAINQRNDLLILNLEKDTKFSLKKNSFL